MNAVTQLQEHHLEETLSHYDIGQLIRYWPAANGIENSNYFIEATKDGRAHDYVLTVIEQPSNAGASYIDMMDDLAAAGLAVAPPLRNMAAMAVDAVDGKPALLQTRLPGKHVYNPTTKQVCALAKFIAYMHSAMASSEVDLPQYPRDTFWLSERAGMTRGYIPFADQVLLDSGVSEVRHLLQRNDVKALPTGMIHADLFRDNVLFNEHGLSGVLDFHHASHGYLIYDLAVVANDWCSDASGQLDPERTFAMLKAYHAVRPLESEEIWYFSAFALYAALTFWLSRLAVALDNQSKKLVRFKNPDDFKQIVEQHTRHFFYMDERRFDL